MIAAEIMTKTVKTVGPDATIDEAIDVMLSAHVSGLPVVPGSQPRALAAQRMSWRESKAREALMAPPLTAIRRPAPPPVLRRGHSPAGLGCTDVGGSE